MTVATDSTFAPVPEDATPADLSAEVKRELAKAEREIAKKYIGIFPLFMVAWWAINLTVWLSIWPLYFLGIIPLWLGSLLSLLCMGTCYLPSHEAQHGNISQRGGKWRWLNELIGYTATIPVTFGYQVLRITHMKHHAHANDPAKDPDITSKAKNSLDFWIRYLKYIQPGARDYYGIVLADHPDRSEAQRAIFEQMLLRSVFLAVMVGLAWSGYAIEAAVLWWLPRIVAVGYLRYYLSWAPHHPFEETGRYRDTRAWKCLTGGRLGAVVSLGMEYHIVHHLHPNIPLNYTPRAYWEMRDILVRRGCQIDGL